MRCSSCAACTPVPLGGRVALRIVRAGRLYHLLVLIAGAPAVGRLLRQILLDVVPSRGRSRVREAVAGSAHADGRSGTVDDRTVPEVIQGLRVLVHRTALVFRRRLEGAVTALGGGRSGRLAQLAVHFVEAEVVAVWETPHHQVFGDTVDQHIGAGAHRAPISVGIDREAPGTAGKIVSAAQTGHRSRSDWPPPRARNPR